MLAVDTCVILDLLMAQDSGRRQEAEDVLAKHGKDYKILLPAIVIAEIAGSGPIRGDQGGATQRQQRIQVAHQWIRDSAHLVAELTERLARRAARLATDHNLKGPDACILATAVEWNCVGLCTRDDALLRVSAGSLPIRPPASW